jgi:(4S)-4-hydroxy-5-phosphonooxypentane-2,3-dione isomerase
MAQFTLFVKLRVKANQLETFLAELKLNATGARAEPGCRQFDMLQSPADAHQMALFEVYDDEAAFAAHQATPHFKRYLEKAVPLLESRERAFFTRL